MASSSKTNIATIDSVLVSLGVEIRHLRYFTAVAEELHFGRAAHRLCMSQPPLSKRIAELEHELGVPLFSRTSRFVQLTPHGKRLLPLAREALRAFDAIVEEMALPTEVERTLRVGFPPETSRDVLRAVQAQFAEWHLNLDWSEATTAEQHESLLAGQLDLGVLRLPIDTQGLWVSPPLRQSLGVTTSPEHALAGDEPIPMSALCGQSLLMFSRSMAPTAYDNIISTCIAHGFQPRTVKHGMRGTGSLMVQSEFSSGGAVMLLPKTSADMFGHVSWRPIAGEPLAWETAVCCRRGEERDATMQAAIHSVLKALRQYDQWTASDSE